MDLDEKFVRLHSSLMALAHANGFIDRDKITRLKAILKQCAEQLDVERASVWLLSESGDSIQCELLYRRCDDDYESGQVLLEKDYPLYFQAINQNRIINANDALQDSRTAEFSDDYLKPLGVVSMLDAPVFFNSKIYGVLCIERTSNTSKWDVVEMSYAASIADTISLINEHEGWADTKQKLDIIERNDSLTDLESRRYFQQRLDADWKKHREPSRIRAMIILGLDDFTKLNDDHGTKIADKVLLRLAEKFKILAFHEQCFITRLGGDTFGFWVPKIDSEQSLKQLIDKINKLVDRPLKITTNITVEVSGSIGVFTYPNKGLEVDSPIRCAEVAMARAKKQQTNKVVFFSAQWMQEIHARRSRQQEMLSAFDEKQLLAYYQPIFSADNQKIIGLEALVRWQHPSKGLLTPFNFLPLVSELGLLTRLGQFMMRQACEDICKLRSAGADIQWVSVNLSADQLYDSGLVADIQRLLKECNLTGDALELEIIEELIGQDSEMVRAQLQAIAKLGVKLSIDDFGTGFSSLSRLKHLPVSKIKIDKSFVDGLPDSIDDQCIVQSIIGLAKGMNLDVVAEGVEYIEQNDWLVAQGCDYIQGYLYARPMDFESVVELCCRQNYQ